MKSFRNIFKSTKEDLQIRTDSISLDDTYFTDEGYLIDTPIVTSIGIFEYRQPDGSVRRELRLPEEVFDPDSLASYKGKPIIITHNAGYVDADNFDEYAIGTILTDGSPDGRNVRAGIVIHDTNALQKTKYRELSLGYKLKLDMTPGVWDGKPYDAIQRKIRVNHLALVREARAGEEARLNVDGKDDSNEGGITLADNDKKNLIQQWRDKRAARKADRKDATEKDKKDEKKDRKDEEELDKKDKKDTSLNQEPDKKDEKGEKKDVKKEDRKDEKKENSEGNKKDWVKQVKDRRDRRDDTDEPQDLESALQMLAEQDEDIQSLLDYIEQQNARLDFMETDKKEKDGSDKKDNVNKKDSTDEKDVEKKGEDKLDNKDKKDSRTDSKDTLSVEDAVARRVEVLRVGDRLNLDGLESMTLMDAKKAIITKVNPEMRLDGKSEAYVNAAFDIVKETVSGLNLQRRQMFNKDSKEVFNTDGAKDKADEARIRMTERLIKGGQN